MLAGTATAPSWVARMDYAAEFGKEPHEIFGGGQLLWWLRWKARRDITIEVNK
ncbi:MAG: hypothetical protein IPL17_14235, partial [Anaerolineales bacterium]|nr:hypothetical protein [Anaerolineales bacterium]